MVKWLPTCNCSPTSAQGVEEVGNWIKKHRGLEEGEDHKGQWWLFFGDKIFSCISFRVSLDLSVENRVFQEASSALQKNKLPNDNLTVETINAKAFFALSLFMLDKDLSIICEKQLLNTIFSATPHQRMCSNPERENHSVRRSFKKQCVTYVQQLRHHLNIESEGNQLPTVHNPVACHHQPKNVTRARAGAWRVNETLTIYFHWIHPGPPLEWLPHWQIHLEASNGRRWRC